MQFIDDSYNANPDSMKAALAHAGRIGNGRSAHRCSRRNGASSANESERGHREVGEAAATLEIDELIAIGETARDDCRGGARRRSGKSSQCPLGDGSGGNSCRRQRRLAISSWSRAAARRAPNACWKNLPRASHAEGIASMIYLPPSLQRADSTASTFSLTSRFARSRRRSRRSCSRFSSAITSFEN